MSILIFIAYGFVLMLWIYLVQPYPDRDSVSQFYFPMLNYLKSSQIIGNDFGFLKTLIPIEYPSGALLIPAMISVIGLQDIFIQHPWLINSFLLLIFSLSMALLVNTDNKFLIVLALFFFPGTQIALKNFNLHSLNVIFFFGGVVFYLEYLRSNRKLFLYTALALLWYACIVKHMGIIFFVTGCLTLLIWRVYRHESVWKICFTGVVILTASFPFYSQSGFMRYLEGIMLHNPSLNSTQIALSTLICLIVVVLMWFSGARLSLRRKSIPEYSYNGLLPIILSILICWITSLDSDFNSRFCMVISALIGVGLILNLVLRHDISSLKGLKVLYILISLTTALVLYFSMLAQVSMIFYPSLYVALILTFESNPKSKLKLALVFSFIVISNFFPDLDTLEELIASRGVGIYVRGFNSLHQNPLGWQKSQVSILRESIQKNLTNLEFPAEVKSLLMLRPHLHSYTPLELQFADNFFYDFPPIILLEQLSDESLFELYQDLLDQNSIKFQKILQDAEVPLILFGDDFWSKYLKSEFDLTKVPALFNKNYFCEWFNLSYWKYLIENQSLEKYYNPVALQSENKSELILYIHRKFSQKSEPNSSLHNPSLIAFKHRYRMILHPQIEIADLLFKKASRYFDNKDFWTASMLLSLANNLDSEHTEISSDLEIVMEALSTEQRLKHQLLKLNDELDQVYPGLSSLSDYKGGVNELNPDLLGFLTNYDVSSTTPIVIITSNALVDQKSLKSSNEELAEDLFRKASELFNSNPQRARQYLYETLKIKPDHKDALVDLQILQNIDSNANTEGLTSEKSSSNLAQTKFRESTEFFDKDPIKAIILLKQVLKLNPDHQEAHQDLQILKLRLGIYEKQDSVKRDTIEK